MFNKLGSKKLSKKWVLLPLCLASILAAGSAAAEKVGDFALLDQDGYFHHMAWYDDHEAMAFLVQRNGSDQTRSALGQFAALQQQYSEQGVEFMMLNPLGEERSTVKSAHNGYGVEMPILIDDGQIVAEAFGIKASGETFLYDPSTFEVLYRGTIDGLEAALSQLVAGEEIQEPMVSVTGADIEYAAASKHRDLSYSKDIAPILAENCASCHRAGGIAPFAMDSHAMVQGWSPMIREVLMTKRMPPAQIDPHVGEFENDYVLEVEDQQKVIHWIAEGAKKDGDTDPLANLEWPDTKWAFGEPDLIVKVPPQNIPATGVLDYITLAVPIELEEDRWVKATQYVAGDRTVLHHTLNALAGPGERPRNFLGGGDPNAARITPYIPGAEPLVEPENTGGLLKAGSTLGLQLHYTTTGRETTDASEIGIWFYPKGEEPQERMSGRCACIFPREWTNIPPYAKDFEQTQSVTLDADAYIYGFTPHMHFRGKRMRFAAHYPDGKVEELINIANYNYNWQMEYRMKEPKLLPAGTEIVATGAFDNSTQNKSNPDPAREVPWGDQSWDEMFFGQVYWKYADQSRYATDEI
ncbi:MAG: redoxin domain-containing protein [Pseudohongiellaceae bacterium]|nr:redoxin domain-containing protein [Pseudohongiellaceae bacterium]